MNKLFKGAIAGAAGVALLLGGAGTFALWNDASSIGTDQTITSGQLKFGDPMPTGSWTLNGGSPGIDISEVRIVPSDVLVYTVEDVPVYAYGTDLEAQFGVDFGTIAQGSELGTALDPAVAVTQDGSPVDVNGVVSLDSSSDAVQEFDVTVTITFDATTANLVAQNQTVNLNDVNLTLQQVTS